MKRVHNKSIKFTFIFFNSKWMFSHSEGGFAEVNKQDLNVSLCRDEPLPGCTFTFRSVVERMQELANRQQAFLLNPTVGVLAILSYT